MKKERNNILKELFGLFVNVVKVKNENMVIVLIIDGESFVRIVKF